MRRFNVVVIPGEGIGPELTETAVAVLQAAEKTADFSLALDVHVAGARLYRETGRAMSDEPLSPMVRPQVRRRAPGTRLGEGPSHVRREDERRDGHRDRRPQRR